MKKENTPQTEKAEKNMPQTAKPLKESPLRKENSKKGQTPPKNDGPVRTCIGCGAKKEKRELIRIVHTPQDTYRIDGSGRTSGRGAYVCRDPECVRKAQKKGAFQRAFRTAVPQEEIRRILEELKESTDAG